MHFKNAKCKHFSPQWIYNGNLQRQSHTLEKHLQSLCQPTQSNLFTSPSCNHEYCYLHSSLIWKEEILWHEHIKVRNGWITHGTQSDMTCRGWDGWMASLTQWTWVWVNSGSWWWTGKPGVMQSMGLQWVRHDWVTGLNWVTLEGFPSSSDGKESACQYRRPGLSPWVGQISWRREWQPIPVFWPGEFHGQRSLAGYSP